MFVLIDSILHAIVTCRKIMTQGWHSVLNVMSGSIPPVLATRPEQGFKGVWRCSQCAGLGQRVMMKPLVQEFSYCKN